MNANEIERYMELGRRNQEVIELGRNWCRHLEVELVGGVGMIEAQTGLPIGSRSFSCPHAAGGRLAGMHLDAIAVDFALRNCQDRRFRDVVGFPNWSFLIAERDRRRQQVQEAREAEESRTQARATRRRAARTARRRTLSPQEAGILDLVDELDRSPDEWVADRLVASARADATMFGQPALESLAELMEEGGGYRASGALQALFIVDEEKRDSVRWALRLLARGTCVAEAAAIVEKYPDLVDRESVRDAVPALVRLASRDYYSIGQARVVNSLPLAALHSRSPADVERVLRDFLRSPYASERARGCDAAEALLANDSRVIVRLIRDFLAAALVPAKDESAIRNPEGVVARALAASLIHAPAATLSQLNEFIHPTNDEETALLAAAMGQVLRRYPLGESGPDQSDEIAFAAVLRLLTSFPGPETLKALVDAFRSLRDPLQRFVAERCSEILGVVAVLTTHVNEPPKVSVHSGPPELHALQQMTRRTMMNSIRSSLLECLARFAQAYPGVARRPYLDFIDQLDDEQHTELKAELISELGNLVAGDESLAHVLPHLYRSMMSSQVQLRAAGAKAFGEVSCIAGIDLPPLIIEAFSLALGDSFVMVHQSAVRALLRARFTDTQRADIRQHLLRLMLAYRGGKEDENFLADVIDRFVWMSRNSELSEATSDAVVALIGQMEWLARAHCLNDVGRRLRDTPARFRLVLQCVDEAGGDELYHDNLVELLESSGSGTWRVCAEQVVDVGVRFDARAGYLLAAFVERLSLARCWSSAKRMIQGRLAGVPNTARERGLRVWLDQLLAALAVEVSVVEREGVGVALEAWRASTAAQEEYDAEAARQRPFSGLFE